MKTTTIVVLRAIIYIKVCYLLTKRIGLQPDTLRARIVVLFILAGAESLPLHVHIKTVAFLF